MNFDFSQVNLQYLIQTSQLAQQDTVLAATMTGMPDDMACLLGSLTPGDLARVSLIKPPLLIPNNAPWWWSRLFAALREGRMKEVDTLLEQTASITLYNGEHA
ncbi:MAG: hypothetical protein RPU64_11230 [Candidatus Sedimenticola sp. (ex Thyasira tokunagai)]